MTAHRKIRLVWAGRPLACRPVQAGRLDHSPRRSHASRGVHLQRPCPPVGPPRPAHRHGQHLSPHCLRSRDVRLRSRAPVRARRAPRRCRPPRPRRGRHGRHGHARAPALGHRHRPARVRHLQRARRRRGVGDPRCDPSADRRGCPHRAAAPHGPPARGAHRGVSQGLEGRGDDTDRTRPPGRAVPRGPRHGGHHSSRRRSARARALRIGCGRRTAARAAHVGPPRARQGHRTRHRRTRRPSADGHSPALHRRRGDAPERAGRSRRAVPRFAHRPSRRRWRRRHRDVRRLVPFCATRPWCCSPTTGSPRADGS
jgi:hypothetical protein